MSIESNEAKSGTVVEQARLALKVALENREESLDLTMLAKRLGTSRRSLQRRLCEGQTSFMQLLDDARREVATRLLAQDGVPLTEVAEQVRFRNLPAFHRAFRRWTGASPRKFQRQSRAAALAPVEAPVPTALAS